MVVIRFVNERNVTMKKVLALFLAVIFVLIPLGVVATNQTQNYTLKITDGVCIVTQTAPVVGTLIVDIPVEEKVHTIIICEGIEDIEFQYSDGYFTQHTIKNIYISKTVKKIHYNNCENYYADEENPYLTDVDGVLFSKDLKILEKYPLMNKRENYTIPNGCEMVSGDTWFGENIREVVFPEGVKNIGSSFARSSELEKLVLPKTIEDVDVRYIKNTQWYKNGDMRIVGDGILIGPCYDSVLVTPDECKKIATYAFDNQFFDKVVIGDSVKTIGSHAFYECNIKKLHLGNGIEEMFSAFLGLNQDSAWIENIYLPENTKEIYASFSMGKVKNFYYNDSYNSNFRSGMGFSRIYVPSESVTAKTASNSGYLVFDSKTKEPILPDCENTKGHMTLERVKKDGVDWTQYVAPGTGEIIEFAEKNPFIFMNDLYVPLRYMCELYGIDIFWNDELGIAEVGTRCEITPCENKQAIYGDERIVVYNGYYRMPKQSMALDDIYQKKVEGTEHSSINIDGTIYVPVEDFVEGTNIGIIYTYGVSPVDILIVEE